MIATTPVRSSELNEASAADNGQSNWFGTAAAGTLKSTADCTARCSLRSLAAQRRLSEGQRRLAASFEILRWGAREILRCGAQHGRCYRSRLPQGAAQHRGRGRLGASFEI